jgi:hypothetical protein
MERKNLTRNVGVFCMRGRHEWHDACRSDTVRPTTPALTLEIARRRRMANMVAELEDQMSPSPAEQRPFAAAIPRKLLKGHVPALAASTVDMEPATDAKVVGDEAIETPEMQALNRNNRKPKAANRGKRAVVRSSPVCDVVLKCHRCV